MNMKENQQKLYSHLTSIDTNEGLKTVPILPPADNKTPTPVGGRGGGIQVTASQAMAEYAGTLFRPTLATLTQPTRVYKETCSRRNSGEKSAPLLQDKVCPSILKELKNALSLSGSNISPYNSEDKSISPSAPSLKQTQTL